MEPASPRLTRPRTRALMDVRLAVDSGLMVICVDFGANSSRVVVRLSWDKGL